MFPFPCCIRISCAVADRAELSPMMVRAMEVSAFWSLFVEPTVGHPPASELQRRFTSFITVRNIAISLCRGVSRCGKLLIRTTDRDQAVIRINLIRQAASRAH